jgi:hypothetical protein
MSNVIDSYVYGETKVFQTSFSEIRGQASEAYKYEYAENEVPSPQLNCQISAESKHSQESQMQSCE